MTYSPKHRSNSVTAKLHSRLDEIMPFIEEKADEAENLGRMTDEVVDVLRKNGFYNMLLPKAVGGVELLPVEVLSFLERISYAHSSAGWCAMVNNMEGATMGLYLNEKGIEEVFKHGTDVTVAGNGVPRGFARPVDGGYLIKGHWAYGSAIYHAEWVHSGCFLMDKAGKEMVMRENGTPNVIIAHHPRSTIKLLGNWDVLGLRATGSFDYTLAKDEELFVPNHMTFDFEISEPLRGSAQGSLGITGYSALVHTAWAVGVGRRVLDELIKHIVQRKDVFGKSSESASFKFQYAQIEAKFRAAKALVYETWDSISESNAAGKPHSFEQMTMVKLTLRHIHDVISEVATFAYRAARGASLHNTLMQRLYRDTHTGTQHIMMGDQIVEECGRALLGLPAAGAKWSLLGVNG